VPPIEALSLDPELRLALQCEPAEIERARLAVLEFLAPAKLPDRVIYRLELILEEILGNIIRYAFTGLSSATIALVATVVARDVVLTFEDCGKPFDPVDAPEPGRRAETGAGKVGGWGISLVRRFADRMYYQRRDGRNLLEIRIAMDADATR
jgi:serine/threonine-protein kinase RsbW